MAGRHSLLEKKNLKDSAAFRGFAIAGTVGVIAGAGMPSAFATDGQADTASKDALVKPATVKVDTNATSQGAQSVEVNTSATGEWKIAKVDFDAKVASEAPQTEDAPAADQGGDAVAATAVRTATSSARAPQAPSVAPRGAVAGSSVVATGLSLQGVPYVWGGTTPAGWDCIGFVRYVFAQHGVSIGSVPSAVLSVGRQVPYSQVQPGDILYWPGHVAISLGNGQNVAAWNPGMGTRVGPDSWVGGTPIVIRVGV